MKRTQLIEARGSRKQKEIAEAIGISSKHLSSLERGKKMPSLITAWRIEKYYGIPVEELFSDVFEK